MNTNDALLEEYKTLREEIMRTTRDRQIVLGFTITGVGTILGLILKHPQQTRDSMTGLQGLNWYVLALTSFALLMLIAALLLTKRHTQSIDRISAYIRKFIESNVEGLNWETRWTRFRESKTTKIRVGRFSLGPSKPLGLSKSLAVFYAFLAIGVYAMCFVTGLHHHIFAFSFVTFLFVVCITCCFDLYMRKLKSWKIDWDATN